MANTEPLRRLRPKAESRTDQMLSFSLTRYLFDVRFEDSEYAIVLGGYFCSDGVGSYDSGFTHILLLHINDYRPATNAADSEELYVITLAEFSQCLRSVGCLEG